ncbi:hypothetical protein [Enterococcus rotai]|uniref:hypothetical protein n=1 Tax=Enterococcus rotai TaxID=118060 RepID=UPI0035C68497
METKKNDVQRLSAWEKLEQTRNAINEILECSSKGIPILEGKRELIQQELIVAVGTIATFSDCLASGELHEQL